MSEIDPFELSETPSNELLEVFGMHWGSQDEFEDALRKEIRYRMESWIPQAQRFLHEYEMKQIIGEATELIWKEEDKEK